MQVGDSKAPILLVEGDSVDEMRAVRGYQDTGHSNRLLVARTAEHAMTLLRACAKGLRFGLVLLDMHAPRFGAADLIRRIRKDPHVADVPVVVLAPPHEPEPEIQVAAAGANTWIRRPVNTHEYRHMLDRLVRLFLGKKAAAVEKNA